MAATSRCAASTTLSATVNYTGIVAPQGVFTFTVNGGSAMTATCTPVNGTSKQCTLTYTTAAREPSSYSITGTLAPDGNYNTVSGTGTLTVTKATQAITLSNVSVPYGTTNTTLSASVTYPSGATSPSSVTLKVDGGAVVATTCTTANPGERASNGQRQLGNADGRRKCHYAGIAG